MCRSRSRPDATPKKSSRRFLYKSQLLPSHYFQLELSGRKSHPHNGSRPVEREPSRYRTFIIYRCGTRRCSCPDANVVPAAVRIPENPNRRIIASDKDVTVYLPGREHGSRNGSCPGERQSLHGHTSTACIYGRDSSSRT